MKEIDGRANAKLLAALDNEIYLKCEELKEKAKQRRLKKLFFFSCIFILISFLMQIFFNIFNANILFMVIYCQIIMLLIAVPFVQTLFKGGASSWAD
jgi:cell division protein FtsW (lipid II flippase)